MESRVVSARVPAELLAVVDSVARGARLTRSHIIVAALEDLLDDDPSELALAARARMIRRCIASDDAPNGQIGVADAKRLTLSATA